MKIILTGITSGLGEALADYLLAENHQVAGCGRNEAKLQSLRERFGENIHLTRVDVADFAQVQDWARETLAQLGAPDLIINNAALINEPVPLWEVPVEEFHALTQTNINGVFHVIKAFLPAMIERGQGIIANLSSGWGRATSPKVAPYCTTKWAIEGLTSALAQELPDGLATVAVNPGIINTPMLQRCFGSGADAHPDAPTWARTAGPFFTSLQTSQNGQALTVGDEFESDSNL